MLFMNLKGGRGSIRSLRAISIVDARMDAVIAMHPLACGQPEKNGMQWLNLERIF
jgi:hypothetical protein